MLDKFSSKMSRQVSIWLFWTTFCGVYGTRKPTFIDLYLTILIRKFWLKLFHQTDSRCQFFESYETPLRPYLLESSESSGIGAATFSISGSFATTSGRWTSTSVSSASSPDLILPARVSSSSTSKMTIFSVGIYKITLFPIREVAKRKLASLSS
jgi:hypothetical protein